MTIPFFNSSILLLIPQMMFCILMTLTIFFFGKLVINEQKFFTTISAGLAAGAMLLSIAVSFFAILAKFIIVAVFLTSFLIFFRHTFYLIPKKEYLINFFNFAFFIHLSIFFLIFSCLSYLFISSVSGQTIIIEGHQSYFSGVSLEIFQADYYERLKVFDNYPLTWTKYHFFNGSLNAIPLSFFEDKNYLTFSISKIVIVSILSMAVIENIPYTRIHNIFYPVLLLLIIFLYLFNTSVFMTNWSLFSNAYTSILYLTLFFLLILKNSRDAALFFILAFTACLSRTLLIGFFFIIIFIFNNSKFSLQKLKLFINRQNFFILLISGTSIFTMVLSGKTPSDTGVLSPNFMNIANGWSTILANSFAINLPDQDVSFYNRNLAFFIFVNILSFFLIAHTFFEERHNNFLNIKSKLYLIIGLCMAFIMLISFLAAFVLPYELSLLILIYLVPIFQILFLISKPLRVYAFAFSFVTLFQILIFNPAISFPAFALIEYILLFAIIAKLNLLNTSKNLQKGLSMLLILLIFLASPSANMNKIFITDINESTSHEINSYSYSLIDFQKNSNGVYCFEGSQNMSLISSLLGIRSSFDKEKKITHSTSIDFTVNNNLNKECLD